MLKITGTPANFAQNVKFPIACKKCQHKDEYRLADLKDNPLITCSACGHKMQVESDPSVKEAFGELEKLDKSFNDLIGK